MNKIIKKTLKNICEKSVNDAFTLLNHYQPNLPNVMKKQIEDKKD